jgi:hypothetical protein
MYLQNAVRIDIQREPAALIALSSSSPISRMSFVPVIPARPVTRQQLLDHRDRDRASSRATRLDRCRQLVPITNPSSGVMPMLVSTLRPYSIAVMLEPLPK